MPRRPRWIRKFEHDAARGPLPTQIVSSEEFVPLPQTSEQLRVERAILATADAAAQRLGMGRRAFLAFLALNAVFGCLTSTSPRRAHRARRPPRDVAQGPVHLRRPDSAARVHAALSGDRVRRLRPRSTPDSVL
jgi:hypothetical protein